MTCTLCLAPLDAAPVVGTTSRGGRPSRRVACVRCALVQVSPAPSAAELHAYYTSGDYHRDHGPVPMGITYPDGRREVVQPDDPGYPAAIETMHQTRARAVADALRLAPGARVLEVGCSDGRTLAAIQALGMDVHGVEPDGAMASSGCDRLVAVGDELPTRVTRGTIDTLDHEPIYDAIVAFHVIEHVPDPLDWLAKVRARLRPGGQMFLEVPNTYAPDADLDGHHWQWVHLYDFTRHTMMELLARAGFDDLSVDDHGPLRAWAREAGAEPRAWVSSGGPGGTEMARALDAHRARAAQSETAATPDRTPLVAYIEAAPVEVRREWNTLRDATHRIAAAYRDLVHALGELGTEMQHAAEERLEDWHPDPYVHGFTIGEGAAMRRNGALMVHVANAGKLLEITDGER